MLRRRPPSLRELTALAGYVSDYAWFAELVRHLFPEEAEGLLTAPGIRERVGRFAQLFGEHHFPLCAPYLDNYWDDEDEPPWTWLRRGIPFELFGFGYDGLHELWNGYRDGLSALALLAKPPDAFSVETDGIRTAWLESAAVFIPQTALGRIPEEGIPLETLREVLAGTRFETAAHAAAWIWGETGNFLLDASPYEYEPYDAFADPWEDDVIAHATEEWRRADAFMDAVYRLSAWLEEDLPAHFAELAAFIAERLPEQGAAEGKEEQEHD